MRRAVLVLVAVLLAPVFVAAGAAAVPGLSVGSPNQGSVPTATSAGQPGPGVEPPAALDPRQQVPAPAALMAVRFALGQVGRPYLWGGTGVGGYDCSGL